ncbi:hypothetical protein TWF696_007848 [Orbilia brochopaga]|uniref:Lethal giant larvae (Lgl)-like C-terminal domain-containing protein n=1 Tax=Orbilia brochopaga TaxID=3140254 RepID=A0AAV9ULS2_9PEZI
MDRKMSTFFRPGRTGSFDVNLSGVISAEDLMLDDVARYGFPGPLAGLAYDPIQSLLAIGTGSQVLVIGSGRVHARYNLVNQSSAKFIRMYDSRLVVVDTKNELHLFDLATHREVTAWSPPGGVTAVLCDPASDFVFLGLQNGEIVAFDLDREIAAPFKIPNLWIEKNPRSKSVPIVSLAVHPKDLGTILIGYLEGAMIYSIKQSQVTATFLFELKPGAIGADTDPNRIKTSRKPMLSNALFNPAGNTILTTYEDGCMAFWNASDGRFLTARTLQSGDVHLPGPPMSSFSRPSGGMSSMREPFFRIAWCCTSNTDDTSLVIAGGNSIGESVKGLTVMEFGNAPNTLTSSWKQITEHFASPKRLRFLPVPQHADVVDFCLIPRTSPYYASSHDPIGAVVLCSNGDISTLRYPDGSPFPPGNMHVTLGMIQPRAISMTIAPVARERWITMKVLKDTPEPYFKGGMPGKRIVRRGPDRNIVYTIHKDATVRLWDAGFGDEIENPNTIDVDVGATIGKPGAVKIVDLASSQFTGEMAASLESGEVVFYRWGSNQGYHRQSGGFDALSNRFSSSGIANLRDISSQADPSMKEGLLPMYLLDAAIGQAAIRCSCFSDIGFAAVGYDNGNVVVIDLKNGTVIDTLVLMNYTKEDALSAIGNMAMATAKFTAKATIKATTATAKITVGTAKATAAAARRPTAGLSAIAEGVKRGAEKSISSVSALSRAGSQIGAPRKISIDQKDMDKETEIPTTMSFAVMTVEGDEYSSVCLNIGTSMGNVITFKILPEGSRHVIQFADFHPFEKPPYLIIPINADTGAHAYATPQAMAGLRQGQFVSGFLVCLTKSQVKIINVPEYKAKSWDDYNCLSASVVEMEDKGIVLACVMSTGKVKVYSLPALKDLGSAELPKPYDDSRLADCHITREGYIILWTGTTEIGIFYLWGKGKPLSSMPKDILYNPNCSIPSRPTITGLQWIKGGGSIPIEEYELAIGGPNRPMSKKQMEEAAQGGGGKGGSVFGNLTAGFNARTQNLQNFQDNMQNLENTSSEFAKATNKFIAQQKKNAILGGGKNLF